MTGSIWQEFGYNVGKKQKALIFFLNIKKSFDLSISKEANFMKQKGTQMRRIIEQRIHQTDYIKNTERKGLWTLLHLSGEETIKARRKAPGFFFIRTFNSIDKDVLCLKKKDNAESSSNICAKSCEVLFSLTFSFLKISEAVSFSDSLSLSWTHVLS